MLQQLLLAAVAAAALAVVAVMHSHVLQAATIQAQVTWPTAVKPRLMHDQDP
jgi:hypothetical protein